MCAGAERAGHNSETRSRAVETNDSVTADRHTCHNVLTLRCCNEHLIMHRVTRTESALADVYSLKLEARLK